MPGSDRELLHELARSIMQNDPGLADKAREMRDSAEERPFVRNMQAELAPTLEGMGGGLDEELALETIVVRQGRPVLRVQNDSYVVEGPEAEIWLERLEAPTVRRSMQGAIRAVGRIEVENHPTFTWVGTGWLIDDDIIITNRHVAELFATRGTEGLVFRQGKLGSHTRMSARIAFKEEYQGTQPNEFSILDILHIADDFGPDIAFLKVNKRSVKGLPLAGKLNLARNPGLEKQFVATIGYPAADSRVPDQDLVKKLFGDVYNVKRMAPGQLKKSRDGLVLHDCSTLGGNSGSPIADLETGEIVGLHFSGLFMRENRGVSADVIKERLRKLGSSSSSVSRRIALDSQPPVQIGEDSQPSVQLTNPSTDTHSDDGVRTYRLDVTIPIEVSVNVGKPQLGQGHQMTLGTRSLTMNEAIDEARIQFQSYSSVMKVYSGYVFRDGWITDDKAIVVVVKSIDQFNAEATSMPPNVGGFPVEIRPASPEDYAESLGMFDLLEGFPATTYEGPEDIELEEVEDQMKVVCHIGPDAGWPELRNFLSRTKKRLTIGIYDFTAPHVVQSVLKAVKKEPRKLRMVVQESTSLGSGTKKFDIPEDETMKKYKQVLGSRFKYSWASVGKNHRFASAYHIKVIVRDGKEIWLSSGNMQSSNLPKHEIVKHDEGWNMLMKYNREWNVVLQNPELAAQFEAFLLHDLKQAKADAQTEAPALMNLNFLVEDDVALERIPDCDPTYFEPLRINRNIKVQPLLTPDNYAEYVVDLIKSANSEILFQNQTFSILDDAKNDDRFKQLFNALLERQQAGVDVRIIIRGDFGPEKYVEKLKKNGFDTNEIRLQNRCHTKAIIVDRKSVLVGSHNWTNQGTCVNRDASLIFHDESIADYFRKVFWFDWDKLARKSVSGSRRVRLSDGRESPTEGMAVMSWHELMG